MASSDSILIEQANMIQQIINKQLDLLLISSIVKERQRFYVLLKSVKNILSNPKYHNTKICNHFNKYVLRIKKFHDAKVLICLKKELEYLYSCMKLRKEADAILESKSIDEILEATNIDRRIDIKTVIDAKNKYKSKVSTTYSKAEHYRMKGDLYNALINYKFGADENDPYCLYTLGKYYKIIGSELYHRYIKLSADYHLTEGFIELYEITEDKKQLDYYFANTNFLNGNSDYVVLLGKHYKNKNINHAKYLFNKSISMGNYKGYLELGRIFKDEAYFSMAYKMFKKASEKLPDAIIELSKMTKNNTYLLEEASRQKNIEATTTLAKKYITTNPIVSINYYTSALTYSLERLIV
jgi:tetratricopeptide (TPR) repeat protein